MKSYWWLFKYNLALFQMALIATKLLSFIDWSWWWVFSPMLTSFFISFTLGFAKGFASGVRK